MRTELNYKKEGFSQIFPILYIKNGKEKAWVIGFGTKNISFVSGENDDYKERVKVERKQGIEGLISKNPDGTKFSQLSTKQKVLITAMLFPAITVLLLYKKRK
jgi:hypothetical protein